jgi:hypothetical protein
VSASYPCGLSVLVGGGLPQPTMPGLGQGVRSRPGSFIVVVGWSAVSGEGVASLR